jgi:hypothetical protein
MKLTGYDTYKARLKAGENVKFRSSGNSMVPKIHSRQECEYAPVTSADEVEEGDMVWCKVRSNHFTHLVLAKRNENGEWRFKIGNNKGGVNGWIGIDDIFGKVIAVDGRPV